jgi:hypothetical protein
MTKPSNSLAEALSARDYHAILQRDLTSFIERSFYELQPGQSFLPAPYIEVVATKLEAVRHGEITRLIVNLPPRYLKSHCASVAFVAWLLGHDPTRQALCVSYGQELADELAGLCHRLMRSPFYRGLFGNVLAGRRSVSDFETVAGGRRLATSVGGVLTGRGADVIILDDPQKADDALSDTSRKALHSWFDNTLLSRLNDKSRGAIIIVTQRLHEDDLVAHVQRQGSWDVLSLPAIAEADERWLIEGPLGRRYFRRKPGDVLHPAREDAASLAQTRRAMSDLGFAAQYQQNPTSLERMRAIQAERDQRQWDAYTSGDRLTLGRLWHSRNTGTPEADITDEEAIAAAHEFVEIMERLEQEV